MMLRSAALAISLAPLASAAAQQPNLLLVVADDLGVDMVGAYGEGPDPAPTPNIDALAAAGVTFRNAWSNPICSASRAVLMTGRYSFRTGVGHLVSESGWGLALEEWTLPEALRAVSAGPVATAAFGKWHLSSSTSGGALGPNLQGFDEYSGSLGNFAALGGYDDWDRTENGLTFACTEYATTRTVDDALTWIASAAEPWFCYVAFNAPHAPYHEPPPGLHTQALAGLDPRIEPRPFYRAMVQAMDAELGRLLIGLGPTLGSTNVVFTADNGTPAECSLAPFAPGHAKLTPYEGGVNVPFIVQGPSALAPGREISALVDLSDVFATAVELFAGSTPSATPQPPRQLDSRSLSPYLAGPNAAPVRSFVYAEHFVPGTPGGYGQARTDRTLRGVRWKLVQRLTPVSDLELYDLLADPFEQVDRLAGPVFSITDFTVSAILSARIQALHQ